IRADGPTSFRLPPVIDHGHAELSLRPGQRVRIATLASQKQRAEVFQIVLPEILARVIFAFDGAKSCRRGEKHADTMLRDHAPECARIRCADRLTFVKDRGVSMQQWSIDDVGVTDGPTK